MQSSFIRLTDKPTGDQIFLLATEIISVLQVSENDKLPRHTRILMRTGVNYVVKEDAERIVSLLSPEKISYFS